ncbi:hypothetical protein H2203_001771 [Taxawa tesnikishii (nom. ined.)]|nr:hypothetical protein H2203_001771 [Dothideales sp. JES 119]
MAPNTDSNNREKRHVPQLPIASRKDHFAIVNADVTSDIPELLKSWNCSKALLVASRALTKNSDVVKRLELKLGDKFAGSKIGVGSHTPYSDVAEICDKLRETKADCLISIGSSSYSDGCKIARLLYDTFEGKKVTADWMESLIDQDKGSTPAKMFTGPLKTRLILVPCSLSVSEYNPVSSATNQDGKKQHFGNNNHDAAAPDAVLLDPAVAATAPESLWLSSGARAIDHSVETICSREVDEEGTRIAFEGLREVITGLKTYKACKDGGAKADDPSLLQAITDCQLGAKNAISGLLAYGSHMGPSHAIGHQLGSVGKVAHGLTSCVCLGPVLKYEKKHPDSKYWDVSKQDDIVKTFNEVLDWNEGSAGDTVERFYGEVLGLPTTLSKVGVTEEEMLQKIAKQTLTDIWGGGPRQIETSDQVMEILELAR